MKTNHRDWKIDATPQHLGGSFRARAELDRAPHGEGDDEGDRFIFNDLGDFEEKSAAELRATSWAKRWINDNYA